MLFPLLRILSHSAVIYRDTIISLRSEMDNRKWEILFLPFSFNTALIILTQRDFRGRTPLLSLLIHSRVETWTQTQLLYVMFIWSFSVQLFPAFIKPAYCRSLLFIAALSLNEGKDVETLPSVYYKPLVTLSLTQNVSGLQLRLQGKQKTDTFL